VNSAMNLRVPQNAGEFSTTGGLTSSSQLRRVSEPPFRKIMLPTSQVLKSTPSNKPVRNRQRVLLILRPCQYLDYTPPSDRMAHKTGTVLEWEWRA
jgi:hypothetical protein